MLLIGNVKTDPPLVLAPLSGISDLPFRLINRSFGCKLAFTEMISANSLIRGSKRTLRMLSTSAEDRPLGIQLLGNEPETLKKALGILAGHSFDLIDFNAACPAAKIVSRGEGAMLLREPAKFHAILKLIAANSSIPVTVKIRSGWDTESVNALEIALRAEDAGASGIFIHGRTRMQGYSGTVDYDSIRMVKESIKIPVIASGDALSPVLVRKMFDETGCDGVALARGTLGNPWIWTEATHYLESGTLLPRPNEYLITETMKKHLAMNAAFHGEEKGVMLFRKFFVWYARGLAVKELKGRAFSAVTFNEMLRLIDELAAS
jgi:tRNA-dihydrouridine synthase B